MLQCVRAARIRRQNQPLGINVVLATSNLAMGQKRGGRGSPSLVFIDPLFSSIFPATNIYPDHSSVAPFSPPCPWALGLTLRQSPRGPTALAGLLLPISDMRICLARDLVAMRSYGDLRGDVTSAPEWTLIRQSPGCLDQSFAKFFSKFRWGSGNAKFSRKLGAFSKISVSLKFPKFSTFNLRRT